MKKILFLLLLIFGNLSFSEYVKEGTYNGAREKKIFLKSYRTDDGIKYFLVALNGYVQGDIFETEEKFSKIKEGEIVKFSLDKHYEDFQDEDEKTDYSCTLKVAFTENNGILLDTDNDCAGPVMLASGNYRYSEKDSNVPEKYWGKWTYKTDTGSDICAYIDKNVFAHDSDNGNYLVGVREENGDLILDGLEIYEGKPFRREFKYKFLQNGNINIDVYQGSTDDKLYNSYNNLRKLKGKELSQCKTFLED